LSWPQALLAFFIALLASLMLVVFPVPPWRCALEWSICRAAQSQPHANPPLGGLAMYAAVVIAGAFRLHGALHDANAQPLGDQRCGCRMLQPMGACSPLKAKSTAITTAAYIARPPEGGLA